MLDFAMSGCCQAKGAEPESAIHASGRIAAACINPQEVDAAHKAEKEAKDDLWWGVDAKAGKGSGSMMKAASNGRLMSGWE
nr:uncharacterized protein CTRU02_15851 [Colletotrichum truncatum]XP_036576038.1 uncharacterized protein CTRU02_14028 [Colletotrichum truncatum]KAF6780592.1 hypothetical protein CTRU02_15851 [Colletotrichum truncatum]KAF6782709.1 hypothetical protein CTRU02_14028 [Colletotrichum truncatum]